MEEESEIKRFQEGGTIKIKDCTTSMSILQMERMFKFRVKEIDNIKEECNENQVVCTYAQRNWGIVGHMPRAEREKDGKKRMLQEAAEKNGIVGHMPRAEGGKDGKKRMLQEAAEKSSIVGHMPKAEGEKDGKKRMLQEAAEKSSIVGHMPRAEGGKDGKKRMLQEAAEKKGKQGGEKQLVLAVGYRGRGVRHGHLATAAMGKGAMGRRQWAAVAAPGSSSTTGQQRALRTVRRQHLDQTIRSTVIRLMMMN
ncbi:hypothetical protein FRX31_026981 [Thalictrum thalictroides]|uniref:Uncharacterized protein n=1 Tax=Thalictrum thalictroides TaxID=46969 RepID=A0A7J6VFI1_THATH|nr:hypothetical protein FRX31_026981 [Thalictrum thalictroides]